MKNNFSTQAKAYAQFRPDYPDEMIAKIVSYVETHGAALDVATGNGQIATKLCDYFDAVYATDISANQIENAIAKPNVIYAVEPAEKTKFNDYEFDLITVGQAIHWLDFEKFYSEVYRILKPDGIFAVLGYGLFKTNQASDEILKDFYHNIVGPFWDVERRFIDEMYQTIPFPFDEIEVSEVENRFTWTFEQLIGYLETWSATQHFIKANGENPIEIVRNELKKTWENSNKEVVFPLLLRIGKLKN